MSCIQACRTRRAKPCCLCPDFLACQNPNDVSFDLRRGEILGLAGLVGAGRTELLRSIFALDPVRSGRVRVGTSIPAPRPRPASAPDWPMSRKIANARVSRRPARSPTTSPTAGSPRTAAGVG